MRKTVLVTLLTVILTTISTAIIFSGIGKFAVKQTAYSNISFWALTGYYFVIIFCLQIVAFFWILYLLANYMLHKNFNVLIVAIITGAGTLAIGAILSQLKIETYYYEPFKNPYQVWSFFFTGFFYPLIFDFVRKSTLKSS